MTRLILLVSVCIICSACTSTKVLNLNSPEQRQEMNRIVSAHEAAVQLRSGEWLRVRDFTLSPDSLWLQRLDFRNATIPTEEIDVLRVFRAKKRTITTTALGLFGATAGLVAGSVYGSTGAIYSTGKGTAESTPDDRILGMLTGLATGMLLGQFVGSRERTYTDYVLRY